MTSNLISEPKETTIHLEHETSTPDPKDVEVEVVELIDNEGKVLKKENHTESSISSVTTDDYLDYLRENDTVTEDYLEYYDEKENTVSKSVDEEVIHDQLFEISTFKPETMLGHYESPSGCNYKEVGSCQYALRYFHDPNGIRFVIEVKGVTSTDFGFAPLQEPYFQNSEFITVDKEFNVVEILRDK